MSFPVDATLEFTKYATSTPSENPGTGKVFGSIFRGSDCIQYWKDEQGNEFSDQLKVVTVTASKTLKASDRKTIQHYTGTANGIITIPASSSVAYTAGSEIFIFRDTTAKALSLSFPASAIVEGPTNYQDAFYPEEMVRLTCLDADVWRVDSITNLQIGVRTYTFRAKATWTATATGANLIRVTSANQSGTISVGLDTEHSGGVFAVKLPGAVGISSTVHEVDPHGIYANAVHIRRPIDGSATSGYPIAFDDGGTKRLVFGLLQCSSTTTDGATINGNNLQISFVYEDSSGTLRNCPVSGNIEYQLKFAVSDRDFPLEP
jgi:hypothetical protein